MSISNLGFGGEQLDSIWVLHASQQANESVSQG